MLLNYFINITLLFCFQSIILRFFIISCYISGIENFYISVSFSMDISFLLLFWHPLTIPKKEDFAAERETKKFLQPNRKEEKNLILNFYFRNQVTWQHIFFNYLPKSLTTLCRFSAKLVISKELAETNCFMIR